MNPVFAFEIFFCTLSCVYSCYQNVYFNNNKDHCHRFYIIPVPRHLTAKQLLKFFYIISYQHMGFYCVHPYTSHFTCSPPKLISYRREAENYRMFTTTKRTYNSKIYHNAAFQRLIFS